MQKLRKVGMRWKDRGKDSGLSVPVGGCAKGTGGAMWIFLRALSSCKRCWVCPGHPAVPIRLVFPQQLCPCLGLGVWPWKKTLQQVGRVILVFPMELFLNFWWCPCPSLVCQEHQKQEFPVSSHPSHPQLGCYYTMLSVFFPWHLQKNRKITLFSCL